MDIENINQISVYSIGVPTGLFMEVILFTILQENSRIKYLIVTVSLNGIKELFKPLMLF